MAQHTEADSDDEATESSPLLTGAIGVGLCLFSIYLFSYVTAFEAGEAVGRRMWWPIAVAYDLGGRWPPVLLVAGLGLVTVAIAVRRVLRRPEGS